MKKIFLILALLVVSIATFAGPGVKQGDYVSVGTTASSDTLKTNDTVRFDIYVEHTNFVTPSVQIFLDKTGSADTTVALTFLQSLDGINYTTINKGTVGSLTGMTETLSPTADTYYLRNFDELGGFFSGRYLRIQLISKPKTGFKAKISAKVKFNIN